VGGFPHPRKGVKPADDEEKAGLRKWRTAQERGDNGRVICDITENREENRKKGSRLEGAGEEGSTNGKEGRASP